jgi:hypothetical protein
VKIALISFHLNLDRYPKKWINDYKNSIINQTYNNFDIFELNYGGDEKKIFDNSIFISKDLKNHANAHNYLLDHIFNLGYDLILNTNIDDIYALNRVEKQVEAYNPNITIMSSNYILFSDDVNNILSKTNFNVNSIEREFELDHNIIAHPVCAYSRDLLNYDYHLKESSIPKDDFELWKKILRLKGSFNILNDYLLFYRKSDLKTSI